MNSLEVVRTEHKIMINQKERVILEGRLDLIMPKDKHSTSSTGYEIRTLYFDSVDDRCVYEKLDGLRNHEKIRMRIYGHSNQVIKLESKRKVGEFQVKKTMLIDKETAIELSKGNYGILLKNENPMALMFYQKLSKGMRPKTIIQYQRLSYCLDTNNIRITFDSNIRATECCFNLFQEPLLAHPIIPQNYLILEVKYNGFLFDYIKEALKVVNKSSSSYSKYLAGRDFYRGFI